MYFDFLPMMSARGVLFSEVGEVLEFARAEPMVKFVRCVLVSSGNFEINFSKLTTSTRIRLVDVPWNIRHFSRNFLADSSICTTLGRVECSHSDETVCAA